jgi:hypothetical protein
MPYEKGMVKEGAKKGGAHPILCQIRPTSAQLARRRANWENDALSNFKKGVRFIFVQQKVRYYE